uniref:uncharacterized protein LOC105349449 n=1 Tax=Fragaria vesca subsp. vesca TaxID=101020 RepID=UPI0005CB16FD|nr:PREDICTED: uncharacterized protein LOC105349449 [Fragaria vesca subsp. vesca]
MLYLYLAASNTAVSSALIRKDDTIELLVYYAGKGYTLAESKYPDLEKVALALIVTARKLRHYFQAHSITLYTNCPLRQVLQRLEASGMLAKWAIELGEFDIHYMPRVAIKGQAAADFISELTPMKEREEHPEVGGEVTMAPKDVRPSCKLYVDGSVTKDKSRAGIILVSPDGFKYKYALEFKFSTSNNAAEYKALIGRLQLAQEIGAKINQIPQKDNSNADALARLATGTRQKGRKKVKVEILDRPSISKTISEVFAITVGPREPAWMDPIIEFLKEGVRPENRRHARKLQSRCARYTLIDGKLYRRGYCLPNLKCVSVKEGETILRDIHEGVCGNHSASRSLSFKALRTGYFWSNMGKMANQMSAKCHKCHQHANKIHSPSIALSILMSPWPFAEWGLDLIGKLPTAPGQYKYAIVVVDYCTKWVEAELLSRITTENVKNFLMKNIYCKFGIPETIVTDNGTQFNNPKLIEFAEGMGTRMLFASVAYPKTNGQVEAVNKIIKKLLKKKLGDAKGSWAQKLPETLWAIRTTATEYTGETPFSLAFGTEAVIPIELTVPSGRVEGYNKDTNTEGLQLNSDLIEEKRDKADLHNQVYKQRMAWHYDSKVRPRSLGLRD